MSSPKSPADASGTPLSVQCQCGKKLSVKPQLAGKKIRCPVCERVLLVPISNEMEAVQTTLVADQTLPNPVTARTVSATIPLPTAPETFTAHAPLPQTKPAAASPTAVPSPRPKPVVQRPSPVALETIAAAPPAESPPPTRGNRLALLLAGAIALSAALAWFFLIRNATPASNQVDDVLAAAISSSGLPARHKHPKGMEFVLVPKGKMTMGGYAGRIGATEFECTESFYLGTYEVTQSEWQQFMDANPSGFAPGGSEQESIRGIPAGEFGRFPVERVSWEDCQAFLVKLNAADPTPGWTYRLPTEAEWEFACRGGPAKKKRDHAFDYYFERPTNDLTKELANFREARLDRTCKVGSYPPNRLGLYDMHGNVFEWCDDRPLGSSQHSRRGGAWNCDAGSCRAASRLLYTPLALRPDHGLRVARVPTSK